MHITGKQEKLWFDKEELWSLYGMGSALKKQTSI